ncbi:MAG TPA: nucleoside hydrolase [Streptosporangiaceae bacterium]|jgi:purine nucleosidase
MASKIILDCDPGVDDALAIVFAVGSPEIELLGVTTVAGNVGLDKTTGNALRLREFLGAGWPVTAGSAVPLLRPPMHGEDVHGASGLGRAVLPPAQAGPQTGHGVDFIIDMVLSAPGEITLVATGPLTNVALALRREPRLPSLVRDFVIMGGSSARGNVTPAAEFNIAVDPDAAAIVFSAGWTVTMIGLDVTLQARANQAIRDRLATLGRLAADLLLPCLAGYTDGALAEGALAEGTVAEAAAPGRADPAVHDVCAVAHVARAGLLGCDAARVEVETMGRWTTGMTVTDFRAPVATRNALVATTIDVPAFWDTVFDAYSHVARNLR